MSNEAAGGARIRMLWLIKGLGPGGAEQLLLQQAAVADHGSFGYTAAYLLPWKSHHNDALTSNRVDVVCLDGGRPWDPRWILRLRRLMTEADVVHGHSPVMSSVARVLARTIPTRRRPSMIYTEHNEWARHRFTTRMLNRLTIGLEDEVIAVSDGVKQTMSRPDEIDVVHHGIDPEACRATADRAGVRKELGIDDTTIVVGTVANYRREKAYDVLVETAHLVHETRPDVRFVAVGQGPLESEIVDLIDEADAHGYFELTGYRADATRVMSGFDLFVLASRHEGLPVVLMEALALDLPIVATDVGGVREAFEPLGCNGIVPPNDPESLAAAVLRHLDGDNAGPSPTIGTFPFDAKTSVHDLEHRYEQLARSR